MAKARRKMRRALMKKMRKGALTPGERRDLMELDREVNRANRQAAGVGGAGLAAALAVASKTGALGSGKDALGDFLDERAGIREERKGQKAIEKEERLEAKERAEDEANLSRRAAAAERSEARDAEVELKQLRKAQGDYEKMLDDEARLEEKERYAEGREDMREARQEMRQERRDQRKADSGFDPYIEAVRNMAGSVAAGPANEKQGIRERRQEEMEQRKEDRLDRRLERRGGFDPRTGEYVDSAKQRAADEEFDREFDQAFPDEEVLAEGQAMIDRAMPNLSASNREGWRVPSGTPLADQAGPRAEEGEEMPDPYRPVMTRQGMDLDTMIRLGGRGGSEAEQAASLSDYSPEEIEALIRYDLRQADGGTTPFLRKMRDRIRKKFR